MGIYLFETERLAEMLRARPVDLVLDVLRPQIAAGHRVFAHEFTGYWEDVGTIASYYRSNLELVRPHPRLMLHDTRWPIPHARRGATAGVARRSRFDRGQPRRQWLPGRG
jgi:glucose-1-phosphate adenylyltransferase